MSASLNKPPRSAIPFIDERVDANADDPRLEAFLSRLRQLPESVRPQAIVVSDLARLVRSRGAARAIAELLDAGVIELASARERLLTTRPGGRELFDRLSALLADAYDGFSPPAASRVELIDAFLDRWLAPWLSALGVPADWCRAPVADVRARLCAMARRWEGPSAQPLLGPFREIAEQHEPAGASVTVRALALVAVRNSELETLHLTDLPDAGDWTCVSQHDWRVITRAAAHALARFSELPAGHLPDLRDPFDGVVERHPATATAFAALAALGPGQRSEWEPVQPGMPVDFGLETAVVPLAGSGADVLHAMDPRVSARFADAFLSDSGPAAIMVPSLKHISRNPVKLFSVAEVCLRRDGALVTANSYVENGLAERRSRLIPYNDLDFGWCGRTVTPPSFAPPGRNDPCPCGSGRKYKRCCGAS